MYNKLIYFYKNNHYYFPLIIAFLMPFGFPVGNVIALWIIAFFAINSDFKTTIKKVFQNKWLYVYWGFFLIHILSYFFSDNKAEALTGIEIKISFFVLPFLFLGIEYKQQELQKIANTFVLGCLILLGFSLIRALCILVTQHKNAFFYSDFMYLLHPSYFAMYLLLAIMMVLFDKQSYYFQLKNNLVLKSLLVLFLLLGIFLASSKMGIISAIILLPIVIAFKLYQQGYKKTVAIVFVVFIGASLLMYQLFPNRFERFNTAFSVTTSNQQIDLTSSESTAVRILIWQQAIDIIKQNPVFGTTVGDANDALYKAYEQRGLTGALAKKLNAHNQFLQTFIGTGVIGFMLLLSLTFGLSFYAIIKKQYLLLIFSCIIILNFLVESMLQAQAGFFFFAFFSCLFLSNKSQELKTNH